jgi:hypothetical protein
MPKKSMTIRQFRKRAAECRRLARQLSRVATLHETIIAKERAVLRSKARVLATRMARLGVHRPRKESTPVDAPAQRLEVVEPEAAS